MVFSRHNDQPAVTFPAKMCGVVKDPTVEYKGPLARYSWIPSQVFSLNKNTSRDFRKVVTNLLV